MGSVRSWTVLAALAVPASLAAAQPAPATAGPPGSAPATAGPPGSAPATAAAPAPFDPIGPDGWPVGRSLSDLRALPECGLEGLSHVPGAPITCRPPIVRGPVQWQLGIDWTSGGTFGDVPTTGGAHALGFELDFALSRALQLGARYELMGIATPTMGTGLSNQLLGELRYRVFTDEVARAAWTLGIGGGYALRGDALGGSAPLVRASIAREIGSYADDRSAVSAALELAYEQSLGDARLSAVLASLRFGVETQIRAPADLGRPAPRPWRRTTSFDIQFGPFLGLGMGLGLRASPHWSLETNGGFLFDFTASDDKVHGFDGASWSLVTGPRLQLSSPSFAPFYLQAQGGGAWVSRAPRGELRPIGVAEAGFRALVGCASGIDLGFWLRGDLGDREVTAGGLVLRVAIGSGAGAAGGGVGSCRQAGPPRLAMPAPAIAAPPPPPAETARVDLTPPKLHVPEIHVGVDATATVHLTPPQPVVIDVALGAELIPGVQVRIDPRLLPLARLRGAGWVRVELRGPAGALASFQAQLTAKLARHGLRVDGWGQIPNGDAVVHARFTIWPPGTRP